MSTAEFIAWLLAQGFEEFGSSPPGRAFAYPPISAVEEDRRRGDPGGERVIVVIHQNAAGTMVWTWITGRGSSFPTMTVGLPGARRAVENAVVARDRLLETGQVSGFGDFAGRRRQSYDYGDGVSLRYSPVNQAWLGMWNDEVLHVFTSLEEAQHWATQLVTPNVGLLRERRERAEREQKMAAKERTAGIFTEALETMAQDPGFVALRRERETEAKKARLRAGGQRFQVGSQVRRIEEDGSDYSGTPWVGTVRSAAYREADIDGPGWYYEVSWWDPPYWHDDYLHQDLLRPE